MRPHVCVRTAGVRACVRSSIDDAACVAVLHVHSRMCVNVLRAYVDVVKRVRSFPDFSPVPGRYINIKYL